MSSQIPSAYVIRALARRPSEHCDRCGHRMFVKLASGLCPFCRADRPLRPIEPARLPAAPNEPFAPLLGERAGWQPLGLRRRVRAFVSRRAAKGDPIPNPT